MAASALIDAVHTHQEAKLLPSLFNDWTQVAPVVTVKLVDTNGATLSPSLLKGNFYAEFTISSSCPEGYTCTPRCALWDTIESAWRDGDVTTSTVGEQTICSFSQPGYTSVFMAQSQTSTNPLIRLVSAFVGTLPAANLNWGKIIQVAIGGTLLISCLILFQKRQLICKKTQQFNDIEMNDLDASKLDTSKDSLFPVSEREGEELQC